MLSVRCTECRKVAFKMYEKVPFCFYLFFCKKKDRCITFLSILQFSLLFSYRQFGYANILNHMLPYCTLYSETCLKRPRKKDKIKVLETELEYKGHTCISQSFIYTFRNGRGGTLQTNCHVDPYKIEACFRTFPKFKLIMPHIST